MQDEIISTEFLGLECNKNLPMNYVYGLHTQRGVSIYKCHYCLDYKDIYNTFYKGDNLPGKKVTVYS